MSATATEERAALCAHCGLPVPGGDPAAVDPQFCCSGCETVYETLRGAGLGGEYYALRASFASPGDAGPARATDRSYEAYDRDAFAEEFVGTGPRGEATLDLLLEGVHCAACVWLVERLPALDDGVLEARLSVRDARVSLRYDPELTSPARMARALDGLGYPAHPPTRREGAELARAAERRHLMSMGVAAVCAGNAMLVAFALYSAGEGTADGIRRGIDPSHAALFRWVGLALGWLAILWPGRTFLRGAWAALRTRTPNLDLPISLALLAGAVAGTWTTVVGHGEAYFDSLTVLVLLLLVGRYVQARQQRWAADAVDLTRSLTSQTCRAVVAGEVREITVGELREDDVVEVRAGEPFPADGVVTSGRSSVDLSLLSGESEPLAIGPDDAVHAGSQNLAGVVRARVTGLGKDTRAGRLMDLVEAGLRAKPPIERFADRVAGRFVVAVVTLAALTFALWAVFGPSMSMAVEHTVALLIVACPCALGLATPLSLAVAIGRAARAGVLVKDAAVLERLARPARLVLDKTGTITSGSASVVGWAGDPSVRPYVSALEQSSSHPVARALVEMAPAEERARLRVEHVLERLDGGISGRVAGRRLRVGSLAHLARARASADALKSDIASFEAAGHTVVGVANENHDPPTLVAVAALADVPRAGSREAIAQLRRAGLVPEILSGDGAAAVRRVADAVDVRDARAGVEPEEKLARIAELQNAGAAVVMVGDGVNDAAALAAADVGVAVHGGAEVSLAAADVFCSRSGLLPLADLVRLSRRAMGTIRANLVVSVAYNVVGIALAAAGLMSPLVAAVLMPLSSLTVLTVALLSLSRPFSPRRRRVDGAPAASDRPAPQTPAQAPSPFLKAPRSPEGTAPCP